MDNELSNIIQKVGFLYQRYGIKSISMDDVSRELGISKKTLYQYVPDKEALIRLIVTNEFEKLNAKIKEIWSNEFNALEQALEVNRLVIEIIKRYNPVVEYDLKKYYPDIFNELLSKKREYMYSSHLANMKKGKEEGLFRQDLNEHIIAKLMIARTESMLENNFFTSEEYSSDIICREVFIYHLRGVCSEKGLELLKQKLSEWK